MRTARCFLIHPPTVSIHADCRFCFNETTIYASIDDLDYSSALNFHVRAIDTLEALITPGMEGFGNGTPLPSPKPEKIITTRAEHI